jgi:hypothetical protein
MHEKRQLRQLFGCCTPLDRETRGPSKGDAACGPYGSNVFFDSDWHGYGARLRGRCSALARSFSSTPMRPGTRSIERAAEEIHTPASFASEAYTLREHVGLVRRTILAKAGASARAEG